MSTRTRLLLAAILILGFALRAWNPSTIYFNIHAERDFWRALQILRGESFPWTGSELTQGGRTMGPALYWLELPPLAITTDPRGMLVWLALLHVGALFLTYRIGSEHFSEAVGLAACALFATFPLAVLSLRYLWNPSFIFPLSCLVHWCMADWILKRRPNRVPLMAAGIGVLSQVHLSALTLGLLAILCWLFTRPPLPRRWALATLGAVVLVFSPYLVGEALHGFENTRHILVPPPKLTTANDALIPIIPQKRVMFNIGALKALQVALSPLLYDRRLETGSFSYLHLLGEFGPAYLPPFVWKLVFLLHRLRWLYVAAFVFGGGFLLVDLARRRGSWLAGDGSPLTARYLFLCLAVPTVPTLFTATMTMTAEGGLVGVGAIRYYFILFPMQFILWALLARGVHRWFSRRGARWWLVAPACLGTLVLLQAAMLGSFLHVAKSMHRSLKYSLHEAVDWTTQREAAGVLVRDWGLTPRQFATRMDTLDHTFDSQRWDVPSLEQSLDYAYFTHPELKPDAPAKYPDSFFLIADPHRLPPPDLAKYGVQEIKPAGSLVLYRVQHGTEHAVSPIQNTWVKMAPAGE